MNKEETIKLNYVNNLFALLRSNNTKFNSVFFTETFFSIILINLFAGSVTISKQYSILGLNFEITPWLIYLSLIIIVVVLYIYQLHLLIGTRDNRLLIRELYSELGFRVNNKNDYFDDSVMSIIMSLMDSVNEKQNKDFYINIPLFSGFALVFIVLPIASTILGCFSLLKVLDFNLLSWIIFALSMYLELAYLVWVAKNR